MEEQPIHIAAATEYHAPIPKEHVDDPIVVIVVVDDVDVDDASDEHNVGSQNIVNVPHWMMVAMAKTIKLNSGSALWLLLLQKQQHCNMFVMSTKNNTKATKHSIGLIIEHIWVIVSDFM
jgi:hypothetical protein